MKLIEVKFAHPTPGSYAYRVKDRCGTLDKVYTYTAPDDAEIEEGDEVVVPVGGRHPLSGRQSRGIATVVSVSDLEYKQIVGKVVKV